MINLIISFVCLIASLVVLIISYDWEKGEYKQGNYIAIVMYLMLFYSIFLLNYQKHSYFSTSIYYVEKTIKTEIVNNAIIKSDTLIRIKRK
jgi:membrane protein YdbS with pleckstrin-like domain